MADQNSHYMAILTAVGEAKLANAQALGTDFNIAQMAVGDGGGNEPVPDRLQTALINQRRRAPLNQLIIDPANAAVIIAEQVIPEDVGGWWIREIGLYDDAGDLVAVANCPPTFKPQLAQGSGRTQVVRLNLIVSSTQNITLRIDPSVVLATRAYADSIINVHNAQPDPHPQYQLRGAITELKANTLLTAVHEGLVLLDASAGNSIFTLPQANTALRVREYVLRRTDSSNNYLTINAADGDAIIHDSLADPAGISSAALEFKGDYVRLRSDKNGKWWVVASAVPAKSVSALIAIHRYTVPGAYSYTPSAGSRRIIVKVQGAGAAGAGAFSTTSGQASAGAGGGGGGYSESFFDDITELVNVSVVVGAGGQGLTSGAGNAGQSSSFGAYLSATGGTGTFAPLASATTAPRGVWGSVGGHGIGGNVRNSVGGNGGNAFIVAANSVASGDGGNCIMALGANRRTVHEGQGVDGVYGAGGGGASSFSGGAATRGGHGGDGVVIIEEYA